MTVPRPRSRALGFVAPTAALLVFLALTGLYFLGDGHAYWTVLRHWGIPEFPGKLIFGDMRGLLAAWQCDRAGIDVVEHDLCDVLDRPFNYSPLWLLASRLPLTQGAAIPAGWITGLVFLLALFLLPAPQTRRDTLLVTLATLSTMVVYAIERGNPDIAIFLLVLPVAWLALRSSWVRFLAYPLALATGFLKYYPLTLMVVALRERISTFAALTIASLGLLAVFVAIYHGELARGLPLLNNGSFFTDFFAAKNLPFGIAYLAAYGLKGLDDPTLTSSTGLYVALAGILYAPLLLGFAALCRRQFGLAEFHAACERSSDAERMFLLLGSALTVGCFFAGQNIGYRGIFLLFVVPGLLAAGRQAEDRTARRTFVGTGMVIVGLMWGECVRVNLLLALHALGAGETLVATAWLVVWLVREVAWWWSISVLTIVLVRFALAAPIGRWFLARSFRPREAGAE